MCSFMGCFLDRKENLGTQDNLCCPDAGLTGELLCLLLEAHRDGRVLPQLLWIAWPLQVRSQQNLGRSAPLPSYVQGQSSLPWFQSSKCWPVREVVLSHCYCYMILTFPWSLMAGGRQIGLRIYCCIENGRLSQTGYETLISFLLQLSTGFACVPGLGTFPVELGVV